MNKHNDIGSKIKMQRELSNYTQEYVADYLGISQASYSRIERNQNKISVEKLELVATLFGVSIVDFFIDYPVVLEDDTHTHTHTHGF